MDLEWAADILKIRKRLDYPINGVILEKGGAD